MILRGTPTSLRCRTELARVFIPRGSFGPDPLPLGQTPFLLVLQPTPLKAWPWPKDGAGGAVEGSDVMVRSLYGY